MRDWTSARSPLVRVLAAIVIAIAFMLMLLVQIGVLT
jgi:hypothetical protein